MHQPVENEIDPTSTSSDVEGGILSNDPASLFPSVQVSKMLTMDDMIDLPYLAVRCTITNDSTNLLVFDYDPFLNLFFFGDTVYEDNYIPYPLLPVLSSYYYDFDIEITLLAIKHERGRGLYQLTWIPGNINDFTLTSPGNVKNQKWIWDIEANEQITVKLTGFKTSAWRSRIISYRPYLNASYPNQYTVDPIPANFALGGRFQMHSLSGYNASNVGPDSCDVLIYNHLVNYRYSEYRPIYSLLNTDAPIWHAPLV